MWLNAVKIPMIYPDKNLNATGIHAVALMTFSLLVYAPMAGKGFIHDDFVHISHVAYQPFWDALLRPSGGAFFTPVTNFSYQLDWWLWGIRRPFLMAAENLAIHIASILLLYGLARRLWRSPSVAFWTALGFSLLFPSNTWAVLWIATRAHLFVALFYLLTLHCILWFAESERRRALWILAVLGCAAGTLLAKENGLTIVAAAPVVLFHYRKTRLQRPVVLGDFVLMGALLALLAGYFKARAVSGAIGIEFNATDWYSYALDWKVILENFLRYSWRTCGLLALLTAAILLKRRFQGLNLRLSFVSKADIIVFASLYILTLTPFLMLRARSGIYSYLPGLCAALLLGAFLYPSATSDPARNARGFATAGVPVLIVVAVYAAFSYGHGLRWVTMAKTNASVIHQIQDLQPEVEAHSFILLKYDESDPAHRFPEGLSWGFPYAMRLYYGDPTLDARLLQGDRPFNPTNRDRTVCFEYAARGGSVEIRKMPCGSPKTGG
jgi:hypothetical protein